MVHSDLEVPIPAVYRGLVIGKGGETLKQLQDEFHVRVIVPKGDTSRPVRVKQRPHEQVPGMRRGDSEDDSEALSSSEKS